MHTTLGRRGSSTFADSGPQVEEHAADSENNQSNNRRTDDEEDHRESSKGRSAMQKDISSIKFGIQQPQRKGSICTH